MKIFQTKLLLLHTVSLHFTDTRNHWMFERNKNYSLSCWTYICFLLIYLGKGYVILFLLLLLLLLLNVQSSPYSIIMVVSFINLLTFSYIYSKMHFCPYISNICFKTQMLFLILKLVVCCFSLTGSTSNLINHYYVIVLTFNVYLV